MPRDNPNPAASRIPLRVLVLVALLLAAIPAVPGDTVLLTETQIQAIGRQYGSGAVRRLRQWQTLMLRNKQRSEREKLRLVNDFFNRLRFVDDIDHWKRRDYWATPVEFLATRGGDCEDFSIAKYFTLRELGIPAHKLRITYVKALKLNQAHMVLAYYPSPEAEPLILDNLIPEIRRASKRTDLLPVYSFNGDNLWLAKELTGRGRLVGRSDRISLWRKMLARMRAHRSAP